MGYRVAARVDANHSEIADILRRLGYSVTHTHQLKGFVDLVAGRNGVNYLIEVKDGTKAASKRKLTKLEQKFHHEWQGAVEIIESVADAMAFHERNIGVAK